MDKVKDTMRKGFEKATRINEEPVQEQRKDALQTAWPAREQHTSITGGIDSHLGKVSHTSDTTAPTSKPSMGQPSSNP
ncbi:hypothetical protein MMYC01_204166 [Madurella mycetomatis]|uniref:Uncharacterized protein n=1 Tax=Madurella mycetomatis TaxID=100816 RepID=A0A175W654_9PEZI|nr:hypothetical protein MMYC01_206754 [Madurella mycetomatis]KXX79123.1 hypothetical protein MMYC01_204166 [Madurella mycetomatis]